MAYEADKRYQVEIEAVSLITSKNGKDGLEFVLSSEHGTIVHVAWITPATTERLGKTLVDLGVPEERVSTEEFWAAPGPFLEGKPASIVTELDEYNGKSRVRVKWLNGARRVNPPAAPATVSRIAAMFSDLPF